MDTSAILAALTSNPALLASVAELIGAKDASTQPRGQSSMRHELGEDQRDHQDSPRQPRSRSSSQPRQKSVTPPLDDEQVPERVPSPSESRNPSRDSSPRRSPSPSAEPGLPPIIKRVANGELVETSYRPGEDGKRGGRTSHTKMELLRNRSSKYDHVVAKGHWFGRVHDCWFNPYTKDKVNEKLCIRIPRPSGQAGRGDFLIHEAIGLTDDYDWFLTIRGSIRKACIENRPRNAAPEAKLTWRNYSASDHSKIYRDLYLRYPFLYHFRDESGEDCWAVRNIAQQYLNQAKAYTSKKDRESYLRRNASHGDKAAKKSTGDDEEESTGGDYHMNAATNGSASRKRRRSPSPASSGRVGKSASTQPSTGSSKSAARDARRADKVVALEKEREAASKDLGPRQGTSKGQKAPAATKSTSTAKKDPKGKQRAAPQEDSHPSDPPSTICDDDDEVEPPVKSTGQGRKRKVVADEDEDEDEDEDDPSKHLVTKKIKVGSDSATQNKASSSKSTAPSKKPTAKKAPAAAPEALPPPPLQTKTTAKPTKATNTKTRAAKNKEPEEEPEEPAEEPAEEAAPPKRKPRPKMRPVPEPEEEPAEEPAEDPAEEPEEEAPPRKRQAKAKTGPAPVPDTNGAESQSAGKILAIKKMTVIKGKNGLQVK